MKGPFKMGLKENFSQAVKELTGNTKEDDKKRNAQVAGLKKALDNDPSFSANDRYTEETGRLYYRDEADQYNDRGDGYRQGNTRDGGRPISDSDGYRAGIVITIIPTATIQENETMVIGTVAIIANMRTAETAVITTLRGAMIITE